MSVRAQYQAGIAARAVPAGACPECGVAWAARSTLSAASHGQTVTSTASDFGSWLKDFHVCHLGRWFDAQHYWVRDVRPNPTDVCPGPTGVRPGPTGVRPDRTDVCLDLACGRGVTLLILRALLGRPGLYHRSTLLVSCESGAGFGFPAPELRNPAPDLEIRRRICQIRRRIVHSGV